MNVEIAFGSEFTWRHPVAVRIGYGMTEAVRSPAEAYEYLSFRWPSHEGVYFELAQRTCLAAKERRASAEEARERFISAAIEADVLA